MGQIGLGDLGQKYVGVDTTMAAIDRVVHHSVILDMMGLESYRVKEASGQKAAFAASQTPR